MTQMRHTGMRRGAEPKSFTSWTERAASYAATSIPSRTSVPEAVASLRREAPTGPLSA